MFYGVTSKEQIVEMIERVCDVFSGDGVNFDEAEALIVGTVCAETGFGTTRDNYKAEGRGLVQFDSVRFNDVKDYITKRRPDINKLCIKEFNIDFNDIEFGPVLDYSPLVSLIACRIGYKMIPEALGEDMPAHARYWKKYWNTSAGKGTEQHFLDACAELNKGTIHY